MSARSLPTRPILPVFSPQGIAVAALVNGPLVGALLAFWNSLCLGQWGGLLTMGSLAGGVGALLWRWGPPSPTLPWMAAHLILGGLVAIVSRSQLGSAYHSHRFHFGSALPSYPLICLVLALQLVWLGSLQKRESPSEVAAARHTSAKAPRPAPVTSAPNHQTVTLGPRCRVDFRGMSAPKATTIGNLLTDLRILDPQGTGWASAEEKDGQLRVVLLVVEGQPMDATLQAFMKRAAERIRSDAHAGGNVRIDLFYPSRRFAGSISAP